MVYEQNCGQLNCMVQIFQWLDAKYTAAAGGKGYHLCKQQAAQLRYSNQQIEAWGERSIELMHEALEKLDNSRKVSAVLFRIEYPHCT